MAALIALIVGILMIAVIVAPIIYFQSRKVLREQKNFERGLKMVTLLIHLPPPSDDTEVGSRDARDVIDENISKAQTVYSIIASTLEKGFKRQFYGQRHLSFEIVADDGFIKFYTVVPVSLVEVIKQAVISAYNSARLEEVPDHNIFSKVGKINGTLGGELTLKEKFSYPIATYQDLRRDPLQSVLNALSSLEKEDGAAIQILIRPARAGWNKDANELAKKKRKGEDKKKGASMALWWISQTYKALSAPPEDKGGSSSGPPGSDLSSHQQSILDSIDEKTRHPGFETTIRIVTSSNVSQRAQSVQSNIVASFSLYDAPGRNGFRYTPAPDIEQFATAYIMRFFPQHHDQNILNSVELATLFHFPQQEDIPTSQLTRQDSKQVDGPRNVPDEGLLLGYNIFRGIKKPIRLALEDRQRHIYAVGQTGTGKSTFLENLALQDMLMGNGFAFIDPHGDTAEKLLSMVPKERTEDLIYFCPADTDYPLGLNIFEAKTDDQKDFVIQEVINVLYKLYDPQRQGIIGPRYEHIFRNAALTVMAGPDGGSFIDIPKLFRDDAFVAQKLKHVTDQNVLDFWQKEMVQAKRSNEFGDVVSWFVSKFGAFLSNGMMRNIIGQTKSAFDLRYVMDNKKILLVNLTKGRTGDLNSNLLGMIFVMKFQAAAMSRANIPEDQRQDFCLYVDEFQNFSTDSFATIMSEARKYRLNLVVANQFTTQLTEEIRDAVFGNMGTIVSFRIGQNDVESLTRYFQPMFDSDDLLRVPNRNTIVRTLIGGVPTQPFSMATIAPLGTPNSELGKALKQLSAAKYGKPRQVVEKDIFDRMKTPDLPPRPAGYGARPGAAGAAGRPAAASPYGGGPYGAAGAAPAGAATGMPPAAGGGSFLDQWLDKRQQQKPAAGAGFQPAQPNASVRPVSQPPAQYQPGATQPRPATAPSQGFQQSHPSQPKPANYNAKSTHKRQPAAKRNDGEIDIRKHHDKKNSNDNRSKSDKGHQEHTFQIER
jgi:hypothetical protein